VKEKIWLIVEIFELFAPHIKVFSGLPHPYFLASSATEGKVDFGYSMYPASPASWRWGGAVIIFVNR
jgi:hypothetical protein